MSCAPWFSPDAPGVVVADPARPASATSLRGRRT